MFNSKKIQNLTEEFSSFKDKMTSVNDRILDLQETNARLLLEIHSLKQSNNSLILTIQETKDAIIKLKEEVYHQKLDRYVPKQEPHKSDFFILEELPKKRDLTEEECWSALGFPSTQDNDDELEVPIKEEKDFGKSIRFRMPSVVLAKMKELTNDSKNSTCIKKFLLDNDGNIACNILYNKNTRQEEHEWVAIHLKTSQYEKVLRVLSSIDLPLAKKMKYFFVKHDVFNQEIRENLKK